MFFVNLPLRQVADNPARLAEFIARGLCPELGLDPALMEERDLNWHRGLAAKLDAAKLPRALHLPFFDLQPGSVDSLILAATRERLAQAFEIAKIYKPRHLIGHAQYDGNLYIHSYPRWRERAAATWLGLLEAWPGHPPLYLENTHERDPASLSGLCRAISSACPSCKGDISCGVCFDVGHWHSFAGGSQKENLQAWLKELAPLIRHLHVHDNDGSFDQHLGLGLGRIDWPGFCELLGQFKLCPSLTFEAHTSEDLERTLGFLKERPELFSWIGK